MRHTLLLLAFCWLFVACQKEDEEQDPTDLSPYPFEVPPGFPQPSIPADNALTLARVALGQKLFFDPILSRDSSISCAHCHKPERAFADDVALSAGIEGRIGFRNTPSVLNVAWLDRMNKDGGVLNLDLQAIVPIEDEHEMDLSILDAAQRLRNSSAYTNMALKAYGRHPDPYAITRALAAFQRSLISGNSAYDRGLLTAAQERGRMLFFSERTHCSQCHSGFNFTNLDFINNGLLADYSEDTGRHRVTVNPEDIGKFRVPSLRNVARTAPYLHNGHVADLPTLIARYNDGGFEHPNKSPLIRPLGLSAQEQADLVAFLESLSEME